MVIITQRNKPTVISAATVVLVVTAVIISSASLYTVDETQQAVVTQFGKPVRVIINPIEGSRKEEVVKRLRAEYAKEGVSVAEGAGLRFKVPFVQAVKRFERRLLRWNGYREEIPTKDLKYIWVDSTARWYIEDPLLFFRTIGTEEQAHGRLDEIINPNTRNSITKRDLIEIVRTDNRDMEVEADELRETTEVAEVKEGRPKIVAEITAASRERCAAYGISIHESGVLIKGLIYREDVKENVELRMIEERLRIAMKYTSEGEGKFEEIMGNKERDVKTILSKAYKEAKEIEGVADANATKIYAQAFSKDPEFYRFWKTLELYEEAIGSGKTRLILGTDNPLFELMKGNLIKVGGPSPAKGATE
jgi:membrane protease subunit HflC